MKTQKIMQKTCIKTIDISKMSDSIHIIGSNYFGGYFMDLENRFGCWIDDQLNPPIGFVCDLNNIPCDPEGDCLNYCECVVDHVCHGYVPLSKEQFNE